jgi:hypothetical protein
LGIEGLVEEVDGVRGARVKRGGRDIGGGEGVGLGLRGDGEHMSEFMPDEFLTISVSDVRGREVGGEDPDRATDNQETVHRTIGQGGLDGVNKGGDGDERVKSAGDFGFGGREDG